MWDWLPNDPVVGQSGEYKLNKTGQQLIIVEVGWQVYGVDYPTLFWNIFEVFQNKVLKIEIKNFKMRSNTKKEEAPYIKLSVYVV